MLANISIDDISPHPRSSTKCLEFCFKLISKFPSIKFTLFVPTAYTRINEPTYDLRAYPNFVKEIQALPPENFEIGQHGHLHGIPNKFNRGEFTFLDHADALDRLQTSQQIFSTCGIKVQPIFRPPGFSLKPGGFAACKACGIQILSLYPQSPYKDVYEGCDEQFDRVVYVNVHPRRPIKNWVPPPEEHLVEKNTLSIMYHACDWDTNYFSQERAEELSAFLENRSTEFCFTEGL